MKTNRYTLLRMLRNGEVVVFDHGINEFVILKWQEWFSKKGEQYEVDTPQTHPRLLHFVP